MEIILGFRKKKNIFDLLCQKDIYKLLFILLNLFLKKCLMKEKKK